MNLFQSNHSSNPTLNQKAFQAPLSGAETMTAAGAFDKASLLGLIALGCGAGLWYYSLQDPSLIQGGMIFGGIIGFILALVIIFSKKNAPVLAPIYAAAEGVFLGGFSLLMETMYPGIVLHAIVLTSGVFFAMLAAYRTKTIEATNRFRSVLFGATAGVALIYLATFILGFFDIQVPYVHENSDIGIIFSGVVVVIAALNLIIDFDFIDKVSQQKAPKYMEWYAAFGLMITMVWLYIEILRLLAKLRSRD